MHAPRLDTTFVHVRKFPSVSRSDDVYTRGDRGSAREYTYIWTHLKLTIIMLYCPLELLHRHATSYVIRTTAAEQRLCCIFIVVQRALSGCAIVHMLQDQPSTFRTHLRLVA